MLEYGDSALDNVVILYIFTEGIRLNTPTGLCIR